MMVLEILHYPDPRLREVSKPVTAFDQKLHRLLDDLHETMLAARGIGIAAPQVGEKVRAFIIDLGLQEGFPKERYEFINPELSQLTGKASFEEGCLSVPGIGEPVNRSEMVLVTYQDRFGHRQELRAEGLLAVAIQHEHDHLDGILFIDRLGVIQKQLVKRRLGKQIDL
ncbi:peptide deformylase [bacterium]|nr:peptide deformylase [bacterium]